jgi:nicotinate-nucleotide pyrophosphorylase (carboxylating)
MLPDLLIEPIVRIALLEDLGRAGDVTAGLMRDEEILTAHFVARAPGVLAGIDAARIACQLVDARLKFEPRARDGVRLATGDVAERTALNFLTHLSGVATLTRAFVDAVSGTGAAIAATRKTLPGLRIVQKAAVIAGGGAPHRYGLDDAILIKDNHIAACGSVSEALTRARAAAGHMRIIEVEVDSLAQLDEALPHSPHVILLDNFSVTDLTTAVSRAKGRTILEASGGVTLSSVCAIAETGVDVISVGALTHSAVALDIGLDAV